MSCCATLDADDPGTAAATGSMVAVHSIATDSKGNLYTRNQAGGCSSYKGIVKVP
jgi:hypothetical protein